MKKLTVDVWSDVVCPWCWIGKRHLEQALARFEHAEDVTVTWRAFELDPSAPKTTSANPVPVVERLAKKYGKSKAEAQMMVDRVSQVATSAGLDMRFDQAKSANTLDAHRVLHLAHERGVQDAVKERLMKAHFTEGEVVSDRDALTRLAAEAGLDVDEVTSVLASDTYSQEVRKDQADARSIGVSGVPFFVVGRYALSGAQPAETILGALKKAWDEAPEQPRVLAEGAVCGPEGCALSRRQRRLETRSTPRARGSRSRRRDPS